MMTGGGDDLIAHFDGLMKKEIDPIGLMKSPYPFFDRVRPRSRTGMRRLLEAGIMIGIQGCGTYVLERRDVQFATGNIDYIYWGRS